MLLTAALRWHVIFRGEKMKLLFAPDSFKGSLTASRVCDLPEKAAELCGQAAERLFRAIRIGMKMGNDAR